MIGLGDGVCGRNQHDTLFDRLAYRQRTPYNDLSRGETPNNLHPRTPSSGFIVSQCHFEPTSRGQPASGSIVESRLLSDPWDSGPDLMLRVPSSDLHPVYLFTQQWSAAGCCRTQALRPVSQTSILTPVPLPLLLPSLHMALSGSVEPMPALLLSRKTEIERDLLGSSQKRLPQPKQVKPGCAIALRKRLRVPEKGDLLIPLNRPWPISQPTPVQCKNYIGRPSHPSSSSEKRPDPNEGH
jgi:hypothetical protein